MYNNKSYQHQNFLFSPRRTYTYNGLYHHKRHEEYSPNRARNPQQKTRDIGETAVYYVYSESI